MKCLRWLVVALMCVSGGEAFCSAPIPEEIKKAVTFVFLAALNGDLLRDQLNNPMPQGTAFFVGVPREGGGDGLHGYLVTAKHVLREPDGQYMHTVYLRLDRKQGDAQFVRLDIDPRNVLAHPDPSVDIVAIPLMPDQAIFDFKVVPISFIAAPEKLKERGVAEGSDVFFTGLLTTYYGAHKNTPVVRFGRVAMFPQQQIPWRENPNGPMEMPELYLLETQSYGGNSGSPVFFYLGPDSRPGVLMVGQPQILLAGVMRGTFEQGRGLEIIQQSNIPIYRQNLGIAAVTPAYFLDQILNSDAIKEQRRQEWKAFDERMKATPAENH